MVIVGDGIYWYRSVEDRRISRQEMRSIC